MHRGSPKKTSQLVYGISEALAAVPVGRSLLYQEIRAGRLRAFRIGKRRLIAADELMAWLDGYKDKNSSKSSK